MLERAIEYMIFASRWLLVPIFVGLICLLMALSVKFFQEMIYVSVNVFSTSKVDVILKTLTLIDMALIASLLVMVAISGYENFVSKIDIEAEEGKKAKPTLFSTLDPGTIKMKLGLSIVAISSIHLLQVFLAIDKYTNDKIFWLVWIHMAFVASAIAIGVVNNMKKPKGDYGKPGYGKGDYGKSNYGKGGGDGH